MRTALLLSNEPARGLVAARAWAAAGDEVVVVLLDGAAGAARPGHELSEEVRAALSAGVAVSVHDDALRRRGLPAPLDGVKTVDLDEVADLVAEGVDKAVWL